MTCGEVQTSLGDLVVLTVKGGLLECDNGQSNLIGKRYELRQAPAVWR